MPKLSSYAEFFSGYEQARQTRPNSGGLQRAIQDSTKGGGVAIFFYFLHVKNRTFRVFTLSD